MIAFDLQCANGHTFEGWFEDNAAYDEQQQHGLVTCPVCNDTQVSKIPTTFGIKGREVSQTPARIPTAEERARLTHQLTEYVEKNFDDVGCDFAKEALKIHYGAEEPRNIRGVSTSEEEKTLKKEGIQFFKLPIPSPPEKEPDGDS